MRSISCAADRARGATVVEFLGVTVLVAAALMTLVQMALWLWARNVALNAADEGARRAAEAGRAPDEGAARTRLVLRDGLGGSARRFLVGATQDGDSVAVRVEGEAPRVVPFLPSLRIVADARAFDEDMVLTP